MNRHVWAVFLGIIMISSTISVSSSEAFLPENIPDVSQAPSHVRVIEGENLIAYARPLYTSPDDPSNHEVPTSDPHDGVAKLILTRTDGTFGCSGTLADDNIHVFTAAHCVADDNGNYILTSGSATFEGNSESIPISIDASNSLSHPSYDGDYIKGNDIAILKLVSPAPIQIPGIPHATSGSAVGTVVDKSGYGLSGYFSSGTDSSTYPFGTERNGQNKYDAFADTMYSALGLTSGVDFIPGAIYQFDSDDGTTKHDAFGFFFGISNTGLGNNEVMSASGDSGGPTFSNGELVGITSYGIALQYTNKQTSDCTKQFGGPRLDSSCGEFGADTRVASYSSWIDTILNSVIGDDPPVLPTVSIHGDLHPEGDSGTTDFVFTVTRSTNVGNISVQYETADNTAIAPTDYTSLPLTTLNFAAGGSLIQTVTVPVNGDTIVEWNENFNVNLSNCTGCTITESQGVAYVKNDDSISLPTVSIHGDLHPEGDSGTTDFVFTVTRSTNVGNISVQYETADNTAIAPTDYTSLPLTTLNFAAGGSLIQTVTVPVNGDTIVEWNENFNVNLSNCTGCTITEAQGVAYVKNDDSTP